MRFIVALMLMMTATAANAQNCRLVGNQTQCDNGVAKPLGNGSSSQRVGNSTGSGNNPSSQTIGSTTYFSDGRACQRTGNQMLCY